MRNRTRYSLRLKDTVLELGDRTHIMGVLNVTPDSFSDGGKYASAGSAAPDAARAVEAALRMAEDGADIIDVGGESTRPGSGRVTEKDELSRVLPVIEGIRKHSRVPVSIDTYKSGTARAAMEAGACIINDISGMGFDPEMPGVAAGTGAAVILMHIKGTPVDMQENPRYEDLLGEVKGYLLQGAGKAEAAGVPHDKILIDPGIGFGKTLQHNLTLIDRLGELAGLGFPVVLGVSRKSFIGSLTGGAPAGDRLEGSIASAVIGIERGAHIIRVHDVKAAKRAAAVADAVLGAG